MDEYQNPEPETRSGEHIFVDKTVEAMVREMLDNKKRGRPETVLNASGSRRYRTAGDRIP